MKEPFNHETWCGDPTDADLNKIAAQYSQASFLRTEEPGHGIGIPVSELTDLSTLLEFDPRIDIKTLAVRKE